jgi:hypothetical protein
MMPPPTAARELIADAALGRGDDHIVPDLTHDTRQMSTFAIRAAMYKYTALVAWPAGL